MAANFDLGAVQAALRDARLDAWLFYDFRGSDPIARNILGLDPERFTSRRWYYLVPARGEPRKLSHAIEPAVLEGLPGRERIYLSWSSLAEGLGELLQGVGAVAMQYSPRGEVPYVSRVDAGTVEAVRSCGPEVVSSADLVQLFDATLDEEQYQGHLRAARHLREIVRAVFDRVGEALRSGERVSEADLLRLALETIEGEGFFCDHPPIVAVDAHAADPHFAVDDAAPAEVRPGCLLLFDVWAKERAPRSIYADITWCAFVGEDPPREVLDVFDVVRRARDAAVERLRRAIRDGEAVRGCDLDRATRSVIEEAGHGDRFIHRTGHSIHEEVHGNGANLDDLETHDTRRILARTLFSVEPGIYLPGRFGIRSEIDVWHSGDDAEVTGGAAQDELIRIPI